MSCSTCFPDVLGPWWWLQQDSMKKELSGSKEIHQRTRSHGSLKPWALKRIDSHEKKAGKGSLPWAGPFSAPVHLEVISINTSAATTSYVFDEELEWNRKGNVHVQPWSQSAQMLRQRRKTKVYLVGTENQSKARQGRIGKLSQRFQQQQKLGTEAALEPKHP